MEVGEEGRGRGGGRGRGWREEKERERGSLQHTNIVMRGEHKTYAVIEVHSSLREASQAL